ncbi:MAG: hypothetical protein ACRC62_10035, partial [Microcoleus sp.]
GLKSMHQTYKTLLKGRPEPDKILQKLSLPLDEEPKEPQTALLKQCLAKLDENIPLDEAAKQAMEWAASQSAIAKARPMPGLAVQDDAIATIPDEMHGDLFNVIDQVVAEQSQGNVRESATAAMHGVDDALAKMNPESIYDFYHSKTLANIKGQLDSPEIIAMAKEWAKGKKLSN